MSSNDVTLADTVYDDIEQDEVEVKQSLCSFFNRPVFRLFGRNISWTVLIIVAILVFLVIHNFATIKRSFETVVESVEENVSSAVNAVESNIGISTEAQSSVSFMQPRLPSGDVARMFAHDTL